MLAWLRWQRACLADDIRRWWHGKPGRHGGWHNYTTAELSAIESDLANRQWYAEDPGPALLSLPSPAPGPDLDEIWPENDDQTVTWLSEMRERLHAEPDPHAWAAGPVAAWPDPDIVGDYLASGRLAQADWLAAA